MTTVGAAHSRVFEDVGVFTGYAGFLTGMEFNHAGWKVGVPSR